MVYCAKLCIWTGKPTLLFGRISNICEVQRPRNCLCFSTSVVIVYFLFLLACGSWRRCTLLLVPASSCTWQAYQGGDQVAGRASSWLEYCHLFANVSVLETCLDSATYLVLVSERASCVPTLALKPILLALFAVGPSALCHLLPEHMPCHYPPAAQGPKTASHAGRCHFKRTKASVSLFIFSKMVLFPYLEIFSINNVNDTFHMELFWVLLSRACWICLSSGSWPFQHGRPCQKLSEGPGQAAPKALGISV